MCEKNVKITAIPEVLIQNSYNFSYFGAEKGEGGYAPYAPFESASVGDHTATPRCFVLGTWCIFNLAIGYCLLDIYTISFIFFILSSITG